MKLTTKQLMLIIMSVLLVLVMVMGAIVLSRLSGLLQTAGNPNNNSQPVLNQNPTGSTPSSEATVPTEGGPPHEHVYTVGDVFSANCDSSGYTMYYCSCGKSDIRDFTDPLGHRYGTATVIAATCTEDGRTERTCTRCQKVEITNPTKAGHAFSAWEETLVSAGTAINKYRICDGCDMMEFKSLDETKTWTICQSPLEAEGIYTHSQITVYQDEQETGIALELFVNPAIGTLEFDYTTNGLAICYAVNDMPFNYTIPADAKIVTINADGNVTLEKPVEDIPDVPETSDPVIPETTGPVAPETTGPVIPETTGPVVPETTGPAEDQN